MAATYPTARDIHDVETIERALAAPDPDGPEMRAAIAVLHRCWMEPPEQDEEVPATATRRSKKTHVFASRAMVAYWPLAHMQYRQADEVRRARREAAFAARDVEIDALPIEQLRHRLKLAERAMGTARRVRLADQQDLGLDETLNDYDAVAGEPVEVDSFDDQDDVKAPVPDATWKELLIGMRARKRPTRAVPA